jgi:hypothetical protein
MAARKTLDQVFREVVGEETYQRVQQLKNGPGKIDSVAADRLEWEREQARKKAAEHEEARRREAEEDEARRYPDE